MQSSLCLDQISHNTFSSFSGPSSFKFSTYFLICWDQISQYGRCFLFISLFDLKKSI